ncbi:hypothetical protein ZIOFF_059372 [Zingiber officinale]|uniref:Uncharacterized protein n=1 Tax=Zingiber officinale TaxID=94328 RepID=A0A8J5KK65_ZINOF|nr:hypothetical protein ZIOFF_059372 [Zingiber officinale]
MIVEPVVWGVRSTYDLSPPKEEEDAMGYGYLTNTKVKFLMVTTDLNVKDADIRSFFRFAVSFQFVRRFHAAYVDAVSNPFHIPGKKITSCFNSVIKFICDFFPFGQNP